MHMIESNAEIRQMVLEELQNQADNEGIFDSLITTDKEAEAQALYDKLAAYDELQEKQEIFCLLQQKEITKQSRFIFHLSIKFKLHIAYK